MPSPEQTHVDLPLANSVHAQDKTTPSTKTMSILANAISSRPTAPHRFEDHAICIEVEARELVDVFMAHCHVFVLVHDSNDTFNTLRDRSTSALAAIVAIGAYVRDGPTTTSVTQRRAMQSANAFILGTMMARTVSNVYTIRGSICSLLWTMYKQQSPSQCIIETAGV